MFVSLEEINSNIKEEIIVQQDLNINDDLLEGTSIKKLDSVKLKGSISRNSADEYVLTGVLSGKMHLEDSISLEDIIYPFSIDLEEEIEENDSNTIDILPILWQNIVLEVPLRYTNVTDFSNYSGDGWKLVGEEEVKMNNPFLELKEKFKEEW